MGGKLRAVIWPACEATPFRRPSPCSSQAGTARIIPEFRHSFLPLRLGDAERTGQGIAEMQF